jgi:hypothetical protein
VDVNSAESCILAGFRVSDIEPSSSSAVVLVGWDSLVKERHGYLP